MAMSSYYKQLVEQRRELHKSEKSVAAFCPKVDTEAFGKALYLFCLP